MVTYNRLDLTKRTLASVEQNTIYPYNIVFVDNNSSDDTIDFLDKYIKDKDNAVLLANRENMGIAIGRNQALKMTHEHFPATRWFCTIDNDVELPEKWLMEAIEILEYNKNYGAIGVNMEGVEYPLVTKNGKRFQHKPKGNLGTAAMVISKAAHNMVGYFNTEYNRYGLEDADYGMRLRVAGFNLGYIEKMGIHIGGDEKSTDPYRQWKTQQHDSLVHKFNANCGAYVRHEKPIYLQYKDSK